MAVNKTFISDYMNEIFSYGGIPTTRADIIRDMQNRGFTQRQIDYYQMGMELSRKLRGIKSGNRI